MSVEIAKYYGIKYSDMVRVVMFRHPKMDRMIGLISSPRTNTAFVASGVDISPSILTRENIDKIAERNGLGHVVDAEHLWSLLPIKVSDQTYISVMESRVAFANGMAKVNQYQTAMNNLAKMFGY